LSVTEVEPGDHLHFGGVEVRVLPADHDGRRHPASRDRGPALGFLVAGSCRCWYPGDTGPSPDFSEAAPVDLALVPVGGWGPTLGAGHLDPLQAAEAVRLAGAAQAVPVHWGTWWPVGLPQQRSRIDQPARRFADHLARLAPSTQVRILGHGESLAVSPRV
jgi:L-ascorbate metabolism protein UlaG (beta-lactamase superfamily)